jgi:hypothetical protein
MITIRSADVAGESPQIVLQMFLMVFIPKVSRNASYSDAVFQA